MAALSAWRIAAVHLTGGELVRGSVKRTDHSLTKVGMGTTFVGSGGPVARWLGIRLHPSTAMAAQPLRCPARLRRLLAGLGRYRQKGFASVSTGGR
ncbi:hypothetical protein GCM10010191_00070 [Actinomadura vinacea]|uniref:Uncharacterized protein n=1 Tax=Actinomadura vinacea TaxID=115336 RepID=A0ABN3I9M4_9ACTN